MKHAPRFAALLLAASATPVSAQAILSDFSGPTADGWSGTLVGATTFANGFTMVSGIDLSGNGVLELSDGGFGGGAVRTYSGLATTGFVTFTVQARIVNDTGTLDPDPNASPGQFGSSFGIAAGGSGLSDQDFAYSASIATTADDTGQAFATYATTVRADGSGDFTAFFTPDQQDNTVGLGGWIVQFDDVGVIGDCANDTTLSNFDTGTDGWLGIDGTNSPFTGSFTTTSQAGGELVISDGGFTGGAYNTYASAAPTAGVFVILADVRIVTDSGSIDRARVAAAPGGATTTFSDLSFSQSFSTTGDDSGQAAQTVAVPVITTGPDDITVYLLPDYDAGIGAGSWEIRVDNIRLRPAIPAATSLSPTCTAGPHTFGGPTLSFNGVPSLSNSFDIIASNRSGSPLCALLLGNPSPPIDLSLIGSIPGSKLCIAPLTTLPCTGSPAVITFNVLPDPAACGATLHVQWIEFDPLAPALLPFGSSQSGSFTIGS